MPDKTPTTFERIVEALKNNRVVSVILVLFGVAVGLGQLSNSFTSISKLLPGSGSGNSPECRYVLTSALTNRHGERDAIYVWFTLPDSKLENEIYERWLTKADMPSSRKVMVLKNFGTGTAELRLTNGTLEPTGDPSDDPSLMVPGINADDLRSEISLPFELATHEHYYLTVPFLARDRPTLSMISREEAKRFLDRFGFSLLACSEYSSGVTWLDQPQSSSAAIPKNSPSNK